MKYTHDPSLSSHHGMYIRPIGCKTRCNRRLCSCRHRLCVCCMTGQMLMSNVAAHVVCPKNGGGQEGPEHAHCSPPSTGPNTRAADRHLQRYEAQRQEMLAGAEAEMEGIHFEKKQLTAQWQSSLIATQHRYYAHGNRIVFVLWISQARRHNDVHCS